ncbi:MAG: helix-turn-helix domain-containing protein [Desulfobacterales bacterium]|nr:helix-turn-helix domain-containing protein [Desulfobacterales bacterium]
MKSRSIVSYTFSDDEIKALKEYRDRQKDFRLKRRFIIFLLIIDGVSMDTICKSFKIDPKTIDNWFKHYSSKGIDALDTFKYVKKNLFAKRTNQNSPKMDQGKCPWKSRNH